MYIYIIVFIFSCLFIGLSELLKNNFMKNCFVIIGILLPCFLAAFRSEVIGTDIRVYVKPIFEAAQNTNNLNDFFDESWYLIWRYKTVGDYEIGFTLIIYFITKIFNSLSMVLFTIHFLIIFPIYKGLEYFKKKLSIWYGLMTFYLLFYNASLNMMRQWIAMAFLFLSIKYLIRNDKIKYIITILIAMLFHTSALLGVLIYFIYKYIMNGVDKKVKCRVYLKDMRFSSATYKIATVTMIGLILIGGLNFIIQFIKIIGLNQYVGYISGDINIAPNQILIRLPIIFLYIINYKYISKKEKTAPFWLAMLIIDLLVSQLASISAYSFRVSVYFSEYSIMSIPLMGRSIPFRNGRKVIVFVILIIYLFFYWWFYFVYSGIHETVPYVSIFV